MPNPRPNAGFQHVMQSCGLTAISTAGTTTIAGPGTYYGVNCINVGTAWTVAAFDVNGTNTTALAGVSTAAGLGAQGYPAAPGQGVRYGGQLVIVTAGTPGQYNALWD